MKRVEGQLLKWKKSTAIKYLSRFYEAENRMENYNDENNPVERLKEACLVLDRVIDRFEIDVSTVRPSKTGKHACWLLTTILDAAELRYVPSRFGEVY